MKLLCKVEVINRFHSSLNVRSKGKLVKSTLALGVEPNSEHGYFIIHFSTANKAGIKYSVKSIKQVFTKFINEGKTTIRFEEPPHDLCINCEATELKCFMKLLRSCIVDKVKDLRLPNLSNISVTVDSHNPSKLVVNDRSEFPTKGLPRSLENLCLKGLKLHNFRRDILTLNHLSVLELSDNEIVKIPAEFGRMPSLRELYLANNQLGSLDNVDWKWLLGPQIIKTLKLLDLTGNSLKFLPKGIGKLQKLVTLKIDNNLLNHLPFSIGRISSLRYFTLSKNKLETLPCSLLQCRLHNLDVSYNNFTNALIEPDYEKSHWKYYIGSLVNLACEAVLKNKINYAPNTIPWTLVEYLDNAKTCVCGMPVFSDKFYLRKFRIKEYFVVVVCDNRNEIPFVCYACTKCLSK